MQKFFFTWKHEFLEDFNSKSFLYFYLFYSFFLLSSFFISSSKIWDAVFYFLTLPAFFYYTDKFKNLKITISEDKLLKYLIFFLLSLPIISLLSKTDVDFRYYNYLRKDLLTVLFVITTYLYFHEVTYKYRNLLFSSIFLIAIITAIISIIDFYLNYDFYKSFNYRLFGGLGQQASANFGAFSYGILSIIALYQIIKSRLSGYRFFLFFCLVVFFILILLTKTRGIYLSLAISLIIYFILVDSFTFISKSLLSASLVILGYVFFADEITSVFLRSGDFDLDRLTGHRLEIWRDVFEQLKISPWFGYGIHSDFQMLHGPENRYHHPHSLFIGTLYYGGVVSFVLLMLFVILLFRRILQVSAKCERDFYLVLVSFVLLSVISDVPNLIT